MAVYKRADRVADRIREEVTDILRREMRDPRVAMITITGVKVSDDLRHAKIYFVEMGQDTCRPEVLDALQRGTPFLRRALGKRLQMQYVPEVLFYVDESFAYGTRIDNLIAQIHRDEEPPES